MYRLELLLNLGNTRIAQSRTKRNNTVQRGRKFVQERYLSSSDVAKMTGVSIRTVWNWCRLGKLKACRPGGRDYVIRESDFHKFMRSNNGNDVETNRSE